MEGASYKRSVGASGGKNGSAVVYVSLAVAALAVFAFFTGGPLLSMPLSVTSFVLAVKSIRLGQKRWLAAICIFVAIGVLVMSVGWVAGGPD